MINISDAERQTRAGQTVSIHIYSVFKSQPGPRHTKEQTILILRFKASDLQARSTWRTFVFSLVQQPPLQYSSYAGCSSGVNIHFLKILLDRCNTEATAVWQPKWLIRPAFSSSFNGYFPYLLVAASHRVTEEIYCNWKVQKGRLVVLLACLCIIRKRKNIYELVKFALECERNSRKGRKWCLCSLFVFCFF